MIIESQSLISPRKPVRENTARQGEFRGHIRVSSAFRETWAFRLIWMPDVPHDAHRSQNHRETEHLRHERFAGAPETQDPEGDTNDGRAPHERSETERGGSGMAEVSVLPESHELERNRGQRAERSCEDRWHAEQEDEGRNSVLAPRHPKEARDDAQPEAEQKAEADLERTEGQRPSGPDLEQDQSEAGGNKDAREEAFEGRGRDPPRDQCADERAGQTRGHEEEGEPQEIEVERPCLTKDDVENRHAEADEEIRRDRPAHTTEEGQEDRRSVLASADPRETRKDADGQREEAAERKSQPSFRQRARRTVQGVLAKDRSAIYFSGASTRLISAG